MKPRIGPDPEPLPRTLMEKLGELSPFGILYANKPRHFREMIKVAWENRGRWGYAWRILKRGVCDGCSLGPGGLYDAVMDGIHLCTTRLRLLKLNTMGPFDPALLADVTELAKTPNERLHHLGRLPAPFVRRRGDKGFARVSWDEALRVIGEELRNIDPDRMAFFATSRGISNEGYYVFQKVARCLGSPHVDYCARLCHAPSVIGIGETMGIGAPTCSLKDMIGTDLLVLWGTNLANNQPVTTKYMALAKKQGTRIVVINPYREPGLERYWVPSMVGSALFGTRLMDDFFQVQPGGDVAFANGVLKALKVANGFSREFIDKHATGFEEMCAKLDAMTWEDIEDQSGLPRKDIERFASLYAEAKTAVFVYSMGLTQHKFGVQNVRSVCTLALVRGMVGREKCGVMPIRGHSGVQGGSECGVAPNKFPSGLAINEENAKKFAEWWGHPVPARPGMATPIVMEHAAQGRFDFLYSMGGNLLETMPDREFVIRALDRIRVRVHQDIVLNSSMFLPGDLVVLLPTTTRYEIPGGCTQTSTERRLRYSPEIPGPRIPEAKPEWEVPVLVATTVLPNSLFPYKDTQDIRNEMEVCVPMYQGIANLRKEGDQFQWGGERLFEGWTFEKMPDGKARLCVQDLPGTKIPKGKFKLTTRRGKQFNSIVFEQRDALTGGTGRLAIFIHPEDARELGVADGDPILVRSGVGQMRALVKLADVRRRSVVAFWPEANVLIGREYDPISCEPDYNVFVELKPLRG